MAMLALTALLLVQANDFVQFRICFLDTQAHPWEFKPHPEGETFYIRSGNVIYISEATFNAHGIDCVRVCSAHGCKFVIGTVASVMETIRGE